MPVPAKRRSSSQKRRRSAHQALKVGSYKLCEKCQKPVFPHRACAKCGTYKGRTV
ncbi:MAG: 50S ribosomal protein L32 [Candidatus Magasanikbacteria bacterium CG10_big_fil_rev_8_21_14_0_10_40_10]|uniref:Large ribosomal subunit protein bL32 n=1 Tax=Candidatus Magasanikbacteria bacterium CG10_big_fil_rev_8_21_14_0_10_40_10 TaxID=1974648 RepID=A0A2M6W4P0_9BACT|nr:MAG: 50S ribosomal protein L32 [Candidatus Magasanikbacteria bacterium CG10_big_fil_rev_8_21_14_0_10_40_10]